MSNKKNLLIFPYILMIYEMVSYLSNDLYLPALPDLMRDFQTTTAMAQLTLTSWFLGSASTQLLMGPLSDRYGRRPVLLWGGVVFLISTVICAMAGSVYTLLWARFFQGSAVCSLIVAGYAAIHELYDTHKAIALLAFMASIAILAPAFGPLLGGIILEFASWRYLFWLLALAGLIILISLILWMPESNPKETRVPLNLKAIFCSYYQIIKNRNFVLCSTILCLSFGGLVAWLTIGPLLVTEGYHYSPLYFGLFQALVFFGFIGANKFLSSAIKTMSVDSIVWLGVILTLLSSFVALFAAYFYPQPLIFFILPLTFFAAGAALQYSILQRVAIEASEEPMGLRMAVFSSFIGIAGVVSSGLASYVYDGTSLHLAYFLVVVAVVLFGLNCMRGSR